MNYGYYTSKTKKSSYLYEMEYNELDYDYAYTYFKNNKDITLGGCSSFRFGNYFARNYDWLYDNTVEFIVRTSKTKNRYGVLGVAGGLKDLNEEFVASDKIDELYKLVPFMLLDGINSEGLAVSMNVVSTDCGKNKTEPTSYLIDEVCGIMLPRYILDKFSNATEAVNFIQQHLSIYFVQKLHDMNYELHYLISDKSGKNYVVEFKDNHTIILEDKNIMTNFHLNSVVFNDDGSVFTPSTQTSTQNAYDTNKITLHGSGLERYNLINSVKSDDKINLIQLLQDLYYTNSYTKKQWLTEFVGDDLTVKSDVSDFDDIISSAETYYNNRNRNDSKTWQTVHSSLYDFENLSLELRIQENSLLTFSSSINKELSQYRFLEYNLMSALKNDNLWLQFMEAMAEELNVQRDKMKETRTLYDYRTQLQDGIIRDSEMFGYTPNLIVDNSLDMLYKEYESIPFRIRNKTNYDGYQIIFKQISQMGDVYNYYWNDKKFIRAILMDEIIDRINNVKKEILDTDDEDTRFEKEQWNEITINYSSPFNYLFADKNFSSISDLDKISLDSGFSLDEKLGKTVWHLDENSGTLPTKHLGLEYYADELFTKNDKTYLVTSEYLEYLLQGAIYTKRCPIIPHIGIQLSSFIFESEGYDYFDNGENYSIPKIQLKSCCGFNYMKGFVKEEKFFLDNNQSLDNIVNWTLDADVSGNGRPSDSEYKYISCGSGSLPLTNVKNQYIYDYSILGLFYTFSDEDNTDVIKDYSINKYDAKVYGHTKKVEGIVGKSVDWDGSSYVKSNEGLIIPSTTFTYGFWVKPFSNSSEDKICVFDFEFLKMYYDYDSEGFEILFNNETYYITDCPQDENYNFLFEFDTKEKLLNIFLNAQNKISIDISSVYYVGQYHLYIGTDSNIDINKDNLKFVGIIDDVFIEGKIFTEDEKQYLYDTKFGLVTHLANRLASYELDLTKESEETDLWKIISSQVECNDVRDEFAVKIGEDKTYIGYTNFAPIHSETFSMKYTKDLVFTTEEITVKSDVNGNFYYIDDAGEYVGIGGHIDYESGHYQIDTYTIRNKVGVKTKYPSYKDGKYIENIKLIPKTVKLEVYFDNARIVTYTDNGMGAFEGEGILSSHIDYYNEDSKGGIIQVILGDSETGEPYSDESISKIILSYDYEESLDMLLDSDIYFNYKSDGSENTHIREIALENKNHEILAYMTFPPIQALDEYNYVSATFIIRKNN